jgi:hypothetical protein
VLLGVLAMIIAGIRAAFRGEEQGLEKVGMALVPPIAYGIGYAISRGWVDAAIIAVFIMLALSVLALLLTGIRTTFNL